MFYLAALVYGWQVSHLVLSVLNISLSPEHPTEVPVFLTHLVLLKSGTLPLQHVKHEPSYYTMSIGSEHEFKHLKLSSEALRLFGHGIHSVLSILKICLSVQPGTPPTLIVGLGYTIHSSFLGDGSDPAGHHSHYGHFKSDL